MPPTEVACTRNEAPKIRKREACAGTGPLCHQQALRSMRAKRGHRTRIQSNAPPTSPRQFASRNQADANVMKHLLRFLRLFRVLTGVPTYQLFRGLRWLSRSARNRRRLAGAMALAALLIAVAADWLLADRHLPWRALDIDDRNGFATRFKLRFYKYGPTTWCEQLISQSAALDASALDPLDADGGCGWSSAIDILSSNSIDLAGTSPLAMRCPLAAGTHIWMTTLDQRARDIFSTGLARVHHAGSYACRRMYGRSDGPMSQHAYANAWDVTGFELADGRVISVLKHWNSGDDKQRFLKQARADACAIFSVVLSPDYNAAHRDHFHLDMGNSISCR